MRKSVVFAFLAGWALAIIISPKSVLAAVGFGAKS